MIEAMNEWSMDMIEIWINIMYKFDRDCNYNIGDCKKLLVIVSESNVDVIYVKVVSLCYRSMNYSGAPPEEKT